MGEYASLCIKAVVVTLYLIYQNLDPLQKVNKTLCICVDFVA